MIDARNSEHMFQNNWLVVARIPGIYATSLVSIVSKKIGGTFLGQGWCQLR